MDTSNHHHHHHHHTTASKGQAPPSNPHFRIHRKPHPEVTAAKAYARMSASAGNMGDQGAVLPSFVLGRETPGSS